MKGGKFAFIFSTAVFSLMIIGAALTVNIPAFLLADSNSETGWGPLFAAIAMFITFAIPTAFFAILTLIFSSVSTCRSSGVRKGLSIAWLSLSSLVIVTLALLPVILYLSNGLNSM